MPEAIKQMSEYILSPQIFPFIFVGGWIAVSYSLAKKSGWSQLKSVFLLVGSTQKVKFHSGSGVIGGVRYNGALRVATTHDSLILKARFPGRIGHPPLRIPWPSVAELVISDEKLSKDNVMNLNLTAPISKKTFFAKYAEVAIIDFPEIKITIPWHDSLYDEVPSVFKKRTV